MLHTILDVGLDSNVAMGIRYYETRKPPCGGL